MVIVAGLHHERQTRLTDAVFIVAQQCLADAHLTGGLALGDALFLPQQAQCAGKISSHSVHPTLVFYIQEVNYIALYTKSKSLFAPSGRNSARMGGRGRLFYMCSKN